MDEMKTHDLHETQSIAERLLTNTFGGVVRLDGGETMLYHTHVFRFQVASAPAGSPSGVIVKRVREVGLFDIDDSARYGSAALLFHDWAGLEFLSQVMGAGSIVPQFYAGDRDAGLFVMEDLGSGASPADVLLEGDAPAAEAALTAMMTALGQMHTATVGKEDQYRAVRSKYGDYAVNRHHEWDMQNLYAFAELVDLPVTEPVLRDIDRFSLSLSQPGPFLAYTHGDPCPDNWLKNGDSLRLFDFETGSFRHALLDGIYPQVLFPSCWCMNRLPDALMTRLDDVYRTELSSGCPKAAEDRLYYTALVDAAAYTALLTCTWVDRVKIMKTDIQWGIASVRQRILTRPPLFAALAHRHHHLEALGDYLVALVSRLSARWIDTEALPLYPAFRPGGIA